MAKKKTKATLEGIAGSIDQLSGKVDNLTQTVDNLAGMTKREFDRVYSSMNSRFNKVDERFNGMDDSLRKLNVRVSSLEYGQDQILGKLDHTVYRFEFHSLEHRVKVLESRK